MKVTEGTIQQLRSEGTFLYDMSMINHFISCPSSYHKRHELGLMRNDLRLSTPLMFGSGIHRGIESWYANDKDDQQALEAFKLSFREHEEQPKLGKTGKELRAVYTLLFGCSLLTAYFNKYRGEVRTMMENEIPVAEELIEGIYLAGLIDKVFEVSGKLVFQDHKTSKYYQNFRLNPNGQFMNYKFLVQKLSGRKASGELDMLGVALNNGVNELLRREPFDYTEDQMREWRDSVVMWIKRMDSARELNQWPQSWNCEPYFKECQFLPLCTLPVSSARENLVQSMYHVDFWDPFSVE